MEVIWQGLSISVAGLIITFAALGLVILILTFLQYVARWWPLFDPPQEEDEAEEMVAEPAVSLATQLGEVDGEAVAAIAVALANLRALGVLRS